MAGKAATRMMSQLKHEDGQDLIEYALALIFFCLLIFGIVEFARALYAYHFVSHASRQATRWAAVNGQTCTNDNSCTAPAQPGDIQNYVTSIVPQGIDPNSVTTTPTWTAPAGSPPICTVAVNGSGPYKNYPGCTVQVQVKYKFNFVLPLVSAATYMNMSSNSEMVIAH